MRILYYNRISGNVRNYPADGYDAYIHASEVGDMKENEKKVEMYRKALVKEMKDSHIMANEDRHHSKMRWVWFFNCTSLMVCHIFDIKLSNAVVIGVFVGLCVGWVLSLVVRARAFRIINNGIDESMVEHLISKDEIESHQ